MQKSFGNKHGISILLFLLAVGVFLPVINNDFINFDDPLYVVGNIHVNHGFTWSGIKWAFYGADGGIWLPLTWFSHMLDCQVYGLKPWGHHLTSVLIHAFTTVLVFWWLREMTGAIWKSFIVAALFGLHPLRVESVAWVAERKDVLSGMFWFLTLLLYVNYVKKISTNRAGAKKFYGLMLLSFLLGLMSKPMLVTLPFVLLLLDYWPLKRLQNGKQLRQLIWEKWPFIILSIAGCVVAFVAQKHQNSVVTFSDLPLSNRIENAVISYVRYIGKMLWPENLCIFYPSFNQIPATMVFLSAALLAIVSFVFIFLRTRDPWFLTGWLWFLGTLLPVIGIVQIGGQAMADRYTYIPETGLLVSIVWGIDRLGKGWKKHSHIFPVLAAAAILLSAGLTIQQIKWWKDSEILFSHALSVTKENSDMNFMLGYTFLEEGMLDKAAQQFENALKIKPDSADAIISLGNISLKKGRYDDAIVYYKKALEINPDDARVYHNLGDVFLQKMQFDKAMLAFQKAVMNDPTAVGAYENIGYIFLQRGQIDDAIASYQKASVIEPDNAEIHFNLGMVLLQKGNIAEAIEHFKKVIAADPDNEKLRFNIAFNCNRAGWSRATSPDAGSRNGKEAIELAEEANQLTGGNNPHALCTLAAAFAEDGQFARAIELAQRALSIASTQTDAQFTGLLQKQIQLYQSNLPFRDETLVNGPVEHQ